MNKQKKLPLFFLVFFVFFLLSKLVVLISNKNKPGRKFPI